MQWDEQYPATGKASPSSSDWSTAQRRCCHNTRGMLLRTGQTCVSYFVHNPADLSDNLLTQFGHLQKLPIMHYIVFSRIIK